VENPGAKPQPCPRCGALNGAGFDRCIRCNAPLQALSAGADALKGSVDPSKLWGTKLIVALNVLVFVAQASSGMKAAGSKGLLSGGSRSELLRFGAMLISPEDALAEPWRLVSAMFVHIGVLHIAMNMMSLVNIGRVVEPAIGSARFAVAYLVSGVFGFAVNVVIDAIFPHAGPVAVLTAGASGAVFGAMGLVLGWLIRMRDKRWRSFAVQAVFFAVVLNLLGMSINNGAHLGGLACGALFGFLFAGNPRPRNLLVWNIGAVAGLLISVASLVLAQRSASWGKQPFPISSVSGAAIEPAGNSSADRGGLVRATTIMTALPADRAGLVRATTLMAARATTACAGVPCLDAERAGFAGATRLTVGAISPTLASIDSSRGAAV